MAMAVSSSTFRYADGAPFSAGTALLLCIDGKTDVPPDGLATFTTRGGASAIEGPAGEHGVAAIHWLMDQYYASMFDGATAPRQWAFQYALWELGNDFDGTAGSIDANTDNSPAVDGYYGTGAAGGANPDFVAAYTTLYNAMKLALPTLPTTYRSTTYTLDLLINANPANQNMVALYVQPAQPTAIPLSPPLVVLGAMLALLGGRALQRRGPGQG